MHAGISEHALNLKVGTLAAPGMRGLRLAWPLRPAVGAWVGGRLHETVAAYVCFRHKEWWLQLAQSLIPEPTLLDSEVLTFSCAQVHTQAHMPM